MVTTPESAQDLLQSALQFHQAGDAAKAESLYHQVLRLQPRQPDALHLIGLLAHQAGRHEAALPWIEQATRVMPRAPLYHNNAASVLNALGRFERAVEAYRKVLSLDPSFTGAH